MNTDRAVTWVIFLGAAATVVFPIMSLLWIPELQTEPFDPTFTEMLTLPLSVLSAARALS